MEQYTVNERRATNCNGSWEQKAAENEAANNNVEVSGERVRTKVRDYQPQLEGLLGFPTFVSACYFIDWFCSQTKPVNLCYNIGITKILTLQRTFQQSSSGQNNEDTQE